MAEDLASPSESGPLHVRLRSLSIRIKDPTVYEKNLWFDISFKAFSDSMFTISTLVPSKSHDS